MRKLFGAVVLATILCSNSYAQQGVLSLESQPSQFQAVRPQGLLNNTVPIRPLYNLPVIPCIATAAAPTHTEGAFVNCSTDLSGNIRISSGGGGGTSSSFGVAFPSTGTAAGFNDGTNMQGARVHDLDTGGGVEYNIGVNLRSSNGGGSVEIGTASNPLRIDPTGSTTQPISAATLPLPTGAATEATLATRLADATFTGRFTAALLDADAIVNETTTAIRGKCYLYNGATWDRCRGTIAGGLLVDVSDAFLLDATFTGRFPAGSTPADAESNAVTISRLGTYSFIFNGATWDRWTGAVTQSGTWNIGSVTSITNTVTVQGTKTNNSTAPGTNNVGVFPCVATASPPSLTEGNQVGCSTTLTGHLRVIDPVATTSTLSNVNDTNVSTTLLTSNSSRIAATIYNDSDQTLYVKFGTTASTTSFTAKVFPDGFFEIPKNYTGIIDGIWSADSTGAARITELTP